MPQDDFGAPVVQEIQVLIKGTQDLLRCWIYGEKTATGGKGGTKTNTPPTKTKSKTTTVKQTLFAPTPFVTVNLMKNLVLIQLQKNKFTKVRGKRFW